MKLKPGSYYKRASIDCLVYQNCTIAFSGDAAPGDDEAPETEPPAEPAPSPSICVFCKNDYGFALNKLSVYPICDNCKADLDKKIFPAWVKLFFAGVLLLVVFSIFWNWRFYSGYLNIRIANQSYVAKNTQKAAYYMTKASKDVPEAKDVGAMASYFTGIDLLAKDKSAQALKAFENCKDLPADFHVNDLVLQAEMGAGFDQKDYKLFLTSAQAFLKLDTTLYALGGVSSAYACLYAQYGADSLKQQSLIYLAKAKALGDTTADATEFFGRIMYRLDSRQIIGKDEFDKKYPNGYPSK